MDAEGMVSHASTQRAGRPEVVTMAEQGHLPPNSDDADSAQESLLSVRDGGMAERDNNAAPDAMPGWWTETAARMWPAWKGLERWEEVAALELDEALGELILLLWSVHRFADSQPGAPVFDKMLDDNMHPLFADPVLVDVAELAFALGAAWAEDRSRPSAVTRPVLLSGTPRRRRRTAL